MRKTWEPRLHLSALFSLANAILKLLTEETKETLKLKKPHQLFKRIS